MYKMELKNNEKVFLITMGGFMTEKESIDYIEELGKVIKTIDPAKYSIVIDSRELKTSSQQLIGYIEQAMELITNTPFKKRYSIIPKNVIATFQIRRIVKKDDKFNDTILVESYEEILKSIAS